MNKIILLLIFAITFVSLASAIQEPLVYYKINLNYSYGNISVNSVNVELSDKQIENNFGFYIAEIVDYEGNLLNLTFFDVPNEILWDGVDPETGEIDNGGLLELNETNFDIYIPYFENAKEIVIYDENLIELSRYGVGQFSRIDRNEILGISETETPEEIRTEEKKTPTENLTDKIQNYWWVLVIIAVGLLVVLFWSVSKKR
ncbi:MAG: hypothetical protein AABX28_01125 [Nanoarchaeota archaeon]